MPVDRRKTTAPLERVRQQQRNPPQKGPSPQRGGPPSRQPQRRPTQARPQQLPQRTQPMPQRTQAPSQQMASRPTNAFEDFITKAPCLFDLFFDLPHPGASKDSDRARMIEPPEVFNPQILSEMYEATAISRLARFAFPEHDDHKHGEFDLPHLVSHTFPFLNESTRSC